MVMENGSRKVRHRMCGCVWLLLPFVLCGCGPTRKELFLYEMVLVACGLVMGLGIVALGRWMGCKLQRRWCICEYCGFHQKSREPQGRIQTCPRCAKTFTVSDLRGRELRETLSWASTGERHKRDFPRAMSMAAVTYLVLSAPWFVMCMLSSDPFSLWPEYSNWVAFPLVFAVVAAPYPFLGPALFFYSYHIAGFFASWTGVVYNSEFMLVWIAIVGIITYFSLVLHWHVGLSRTRRGWLLPVIVAAVNALIATAGYFFFQ